MNAYGYQVACKILASFSIPLQESCKLIDSLARFLQAFRFILQDYLQDESKSLQEESKSLQESCKLFDSNAGKGGKHRKGADFCSSKIVLALAWAFLAFLRSRAGALLCSLAHLVSSHQRKKRPERAKTNARRGHKQGRGVIALREGVTNKGRGNRAEERNRQTYKWTSKWTTKGAQRRRGVIVCCAKGSQTRAGGYRAARRGHKQGRGVIALKKETDKHINEHLNAQ